MARALVDDVDGNAPVMQVIDTYDNSANVYEVIVVATDEGGLASTPQTITVTLLDDSAPVFTIYDYQNLTQEQKDVAPQGVAGYVQPTVGAEFIVEEGTDTNTSLLVHTFAAIDIIGEDSE